MKVGQWGSLVTLKPSYYSVYRSYSVFLTHHSPAGNSSPNSQQDTAKDRYPVLSNLRQSHQSFRDSYAQGKAKFGQEVENICSVLSVTKWDNEVEQALCSLPFPINVHHVRELLKSGKVSTRVALCFFLWIRHLPCYKHNNVTYNAVVHTAIRGRQFKFIEKLVHYLEQDGCVLGTITCNVLIQSYGRSHKTEEAFAVFSRMDGRLFAKPNIWTCNLLLHMLVMENDLDWACEFYNKILNAGFRPNTVTCNIWMLCLCKQNKLEEGLKWLEEMPCPPNKVTYGTLIDGFCKADNMTQATALLEHMLDEDISPDVCIYSSMINGYCKAQLLDEAFKLFKVMDSKGIKPNIVTYTTLIDSMLKSEKIDGALGLLEYMQTTDCVPNEYLCTARLDAMCRRGEFNAAKSFLRHMDELGYVPNTVTYCALIDGHLKGGCKQEAMQLIGEMSSRGCKPDNFLYSSLIYEFAKSGDDAKAKMIMEESLNKSNSPDVWIMNCWMSGLCRANRADDAYHLFLKLKAEGFKPNTVSFNILITGFCKTNRVGYARLIFEGISAQNCNPDLSSYTNLVKGYCKIGALAHASNWLNEAVDMGFVHIFRFYVYNICDVFELRKVGHAKSFLKLLGSQCTFSAEADRKLFFKLLRVEDSVGARKAISAWKRLRES